MAFAKKSIVLCNNEYSNITMPIGEPKIMTDGSYYFRVKKPNNSKQEVISLALLITQIIK